MTTNGAGRTYREHDYWLQYQPFLPERLRVTKDNAPEEGWWDWAGARIHVDRYEPPDAPLTVVLLHGGGGNGRLLAPIGRMLRIHGYRTVAPDLPGYGLSDAPDKMLAYEYWVACASDLIEYEEERTERPVVVFGLSLGGMLAYQAAVRSGCARGIIATTLADPRRPLVRRQFLKYPWMAPFLPLMPILGAFVDRVRVPVKKMAPMDTIANDPDLARLIADDPLAGGNAMPFRFLRSLFEMRFPVEPERFDRCPLLFAQPAADRWTTLETSMPFYGRLACEKQLVMLENCGHLPLEEPGVSRFEEAARAFLGRIA